MDCFWNKGYSPVAGHQPHHHHHALFAESPFHLQVILQSIISTIAISESFAEHATGSLSHI